MKILHLISSEGFYGAENVVAALARELRRSGHSVRVGVFQNAHTPQNQVAPEFEARGLEVTRILCRGRLDLRAVSRIREILAVHGADLIHSHGYKSDIYAYLAARHLRLPLVATSHHWTRQSSAVRFYEFLDAIALRRFDAVVAVSTRIREELEQAGIPGERISIIDNGIDGFDLFGSALPVLKSELKIGDRLLIGTVGRLTAQKGIEYFLAAARILLSNFPELLFVIVGDGPDREKLKRMARELNIEKSIRFTGVRHDMANVYASLDIFVLASLAEGMPLALLEAMASGRPVVATAVGAVPEIVTSGETGMLVHPSNAAELASALATLLRDPALGDRMARKGQTRIRQQFSSQTMTQNYCRVYAQLLNEKPRRPKSSRFLQVTGTNCHC